MTADLPPITEIPVSPDAPTAPSRRRGRAPALNPDGSRKHPVRARDARRRGGDRAPRRDASGGSPTPARRSRSLKDRVAAQLTVFSMILAVVPPLARDQLSPQEIDLLADGIAKQCDASPRFRKYVELALNASGTGGLVFAVAIVGARRAARHDILPSQVDVLLGGMIGEPFNPAMPNADTLRAMHEANREEVERNIEREREMLDTLPPIGAPGLPVEQPVNGTFDYEAATGSAVQT